MWILSVLPESFLHAIFWIGVLSTALSYVTGILPFLRTYKLALQIGGILVLALGAYLEGALSNEKIWQLKALQLEAQNSKVETEIAKQDVQIVEKVVNKTKIIKERGQDVIKYVDREIIKYDTKFIKGGECEIPKEFFEAYNKSMELPTK